MTWLYKDTLNVQLSHVPQQGPDIQCSRAWVNSSPEYTSCLSHNNIAVGTSFLRTFIKEKYFRSVFGRSKPLKSMDPGYVYFNQINNSYNWCWNCINSLPVTQLRLNSLNLPSRRATSSTPTTNA